MSKLGKYQLIAELARGGMGIVYLALVGGAKTGFTKLAVVKELKPELAEDSGFLAMFLEEARLASRLNHANIVQTNEVGEDDGRPYIAMEYLEGQGMHQVLRRLAKTGKLPRRMRFRILVDVLSALEYAHDMKDFDGTPLKLVHRDVTPQNIFLTYDGQVKLLDFGIAKAADSSNETRAGTIKGKIAYMPPEQAAGAPVDRRADIFAVGALLWETAVGRRMWQGVPEVDVLRALTTGNIPAPRSVNPNVPDELDRICRKATAPEAEDRYATATELRRDLEAFLEAAQETTTSRALGELLAENFASERNETRRLIEAHVARIRSVPESSVPIIALGSMQPTSSPADGDSKPRSSMQPATTGMAAAVSAVGTGATLLSGGQGGADWGQRRRAPPRWIWLPAVTVPVVVASFFVWGGHGSTAGNARSEPPTTASVPSPTASAPPPPASGQTAAPTIELAVNATPREAAVSVDGVFIPGTPFRGAYPRDAKIHHLRATAPGYKAQTTDIVFDQSIVVELALEREHPSGHLAARPHVPTVKPATERPGASAPPVAPATQAPPPPSPPRDPLQGGKPPQHDIDPSNPYK